MFLPIDVGTATVPNCCGLSDPMAIDDTPPFNAPKRHAVTLRLGEAANTLLGENTSRRGDVSIQVHAALAGVDLMAIKVEPRDRRPGSGRSVVYPTSIVFDSRMHERLTAVAVKRGVPAVALVEAAILKHFAKH